MNKTTQDLDATFNKLKQVPLKDLKRLLREESPDPLLAIDESVFEAQLKKYGWTLAEFVKAREDESDAYRRAAINKRKADADRQRRSQAATLGDLEDLRDWIDRRFAQDPTPPEEKE